VWSGVSAVPSGATNATERPERIPRHLEQNSTLVAAIELSLKPWPVAGLVSGPARQPLKKQGADPAGCGPEALLALLHRWPAEASKAGRKIDRILVAGLPGKNYIFENAYSREDFYSKSQMKAQNRNLGPRKAKPTPDWHAGARLHPTVAAHRARMPEIGPLNPG
jgi:hypothetical protein